MADLYDYEYQENYDEYHRFVGGFDIMGYLDGQYLELLEWHRYLLGWLNDADVACIPEATLEELEVHIGNQSNPDTSALLIVQLSTTRALIVEPKLQGEFCDGCYGVLVYTVDTSIPSGDGPVQIYPATGSNDPYLHDGMLNVGDELQVGDFLISVEEGFTESFIVKVTKTK